MFKAKYRQKKNETIDANLAWLLGKSGQAFFASSSWQFGQACSTLTESPDSLNPLALVGQYFRDQQLQKALAIIIAPGQANGQIKEALDKVHSSEENNSSVDIGVLKQCQDAQARWWASILATACHWMREEKEEAEKLYQVVECYPVSISSTIN